jgi:class 3 adenylate cyclase
LEAHSRERKLAAILAADVARYSRLMGTGEDGALNRLRAIPARLLDTWIA